MLASRAGEANDPATFLLERTIQLQTALELADPDRAGEGHHRRARVDQPEQAFRKIRREARARRMKLQDIAAEIIATTATSQEEDVSSGAESH